MNKKLMLAALCAVAACSAQAGPEAAVVAPPIAAATADAAPAPPRESAARAARFDCAIRTTSTRNGVSIRAVVDAREAVTGDYDLVVTKTGGGGSSDTTQGGPFSAAAGSTAVLSSSEIGMGRGASLHARLVVRSADGTTCRREIRL